LGVLEAEHPIAQKYMVGPITNRADKVVGQYRVLI